MGTTVLAGPSGRTPGPLAAALIGDSIIERLGALPTWFGVLARSWTNAGLGSDTITNMIARQATDVPGASSWCAIYGGLNDYVQPDAPTPATVVARARTLALAMQARGIRPVFTEILPLGNGYAIAGGAAAANTWSLDFNGQLATMAASVALPVTRVWATFALGDGYADPALLDPDHGHLNDAGKLVFASLMRTNLSALGWVVL